MLTKCTLIHVDEVLVFSSSFLFSLLLVLDRMCGPYSKRREELFMLSGTLMNAGVPVVTIIHSSGCNDPLYPLIGLAAMSSTSTGLSVSPCLADLGCTGLPPGIAIPWKNTREALLRGPKQNL